MNNVVLLGRLTRDPIPRSIMTADGEIETSRFTLAVDRRVQRTEGGQTADFISCQAFRKQAEFVNKYLKQGTKVCIRGHIQTGSYTNKDGQKVYTTDVVAETIEFAESKAAAAGSPAPVYGGADDGMNAFSGGADFMNIPDNVDDEGLPFK
ncbi:MAG: single-stranded DNA-binding protein [Clostridiales bacterium]|nr:single-stranded DNA-binding protein [Clostridiales bacterium]MBS5878408.1 single-stranded DNA-binding protein [Clostridiales bacterium]MDU0939808.1 single-stranded DNA-binding protein [Clostridiales bacterium]MDU1042652.1 single-stranded DNA-binding protein [Clostridiales bacterium]MDU3489570.1 single-stranded DNA-binding protein [Clostridiales bacterium]